MPMQTSLCVRACDIDLNWLTIILDQGLQHYPQVLKDYNTTRKWEYCGNYTVATPRTVRASLATKEASLQRV